MSSIEPPFCVEVRANGKTAQKWPEKSQIYKWTENPSKSGKHLKPKAIPSFLGMLDL